MEYYLLVRHQICLAFFNFMKKEIVKFDFEGTVIEFGVGEAIWMNATEIARKFNKHVAHWTSTASTKEYIEALKKRYRNNDNAVNQNFIMVFKGGNGIQGTWIHQKLAIRFAQWLNPDFAVWVDEQIETLLTTGKVELDTKPETTTIVLPDFSNPGVAARAWADQYEARMIAEAAAEENKEKAEGYELLIEKANNYTLKEAADLLGSGQNRFSKWLMQNKFLQVGGIPYQTYLRNQPYFVVKEVTKAGTVYHTPMVTPKGMDYFTKLRNRGQMNEILNKVSKTLDTNIIK